MTVREIMTREIISIQPQATLNEAAAKMKDLNVGILPVCENDKIVGILTDRDIVVRSIAKGDDPANVKVKDIMSSHVEYCFDEEDLKAIVDRMERLKIRRMIVMDHNKKLIGILSLGDISVRADKELAGEALERISEPSQPNRLKSK